MNATKCLETHRSRGFPRLQQPRTGGTTWVLWRPCLQGFKLEENLTLPNIVPSLPLACAEWCCVTGVSSGVLLSVAVILQGIHSSQQTGSVLAICLLLCNICIMRFSAFKTVNTFLESLIKLHLGAKSKPDVRWSNSSRGITRLTYLYLTGRERCCCYYGKNNSAQRMEFSLKQSCCTACTDCWKSVQKRDCEIKWLSAAFEAVWRLLHTLGLLQPTAGKSTR